MVMGCSVSMSSPDWAVTLEFCMMLQKFCMMLGKLGSSVSFLRTPCESTVLAK